MHIKTAWLLITNQCNLNCSYCYIKKDEKTIELKLAYKIIDKIIEDPFFKENHIVLFGGEPLLKTDLLKKIVEYGYKKAKIKNKVLTFSTYTNGTLLNKNNVELLHKLRIRVNISLDGVKESHDQDRLFKNKISSFGAITNNLDNLFKKYPYAMVHACITPKNVKYLSQNIDFFHNIGFKRIYFHPVFSLLWKTEKLKILSSELDKAFIQYEKLFKKGDLIYLNLLEDYIKSAETKDEPLIPCLAGIQNFAFSTSGEIFPCHRFVTLEEEKGFKKIKNKYKLGDINKGITNIKAYNDFIDLNHRRDNNCKKCSTKSICGSGCYWENFHENKSFFKKNKTQCIVHQVINDSAKKIINKFPELSKVNLSKKFSDLNLPPIKN